MKKSITETILEIVGEGIITAGDIIDTVLTAGYGASYSKLNKTYNRIQTQRLKNELAGKERHNFINLISKLKREGLITGKTEIKITKLGKLKLLKFREKQSLKSAKYPVENDEETKIIIFDIPEKERRKRKWIRQSLINLNFRMLQKSVWIGETKIPEEFLDDLKYLKLVPFVHVFAGKKLGSINAKKD